MQSKFKSVYRDMSGRFGEIGILLKMLEVEGKKCNCFGKVDQQVLLKSAILLMMYNAVEGIMSLALEAFFDSIQSDGIAMAKMNKSLQKLFYQYYLKMVQKPCELKKFKRLKDEELCNLSYKDISKQIEFFSGNLDANKIKEVLGRIGISTGDKFSEPILKEIKDKRNALAHGETRFAHAAQKYSSRDLQLMRAKLYCYLRKVIIACDMAVERMGSK